MIKSIFYKEWLKTKYALLLCLVLSSGMITYIALDIIKAFQTTSGSSICLTVLNEELVYFEPFAYLPVLVGLLIALAQYLPEVYQKRLKLTFHLPLSTRRIVICMAGYGLLLLFLIFGLNLLTSYCIVQHFFPYEMQSRILLTTLPWYIAGLMIYGFTAWIVVEPSWKQRLLNSFVAGLCLYLIYVNPFPEAYNSSLLFLFIVMLFIASWVWLSVLRFKQGASN